MKDGFNSLHQSLKRSYDTTLYFKYRVSKWVCNFLCIFKMNINISYGLKNLYILCDIMCEMKISPVISTNKKRHSHQQFLVSKCEYYAKSLHSCPTLCDPIEGSSPGFPFPGILQAKTLEWVVISFSTKCEWELPKLRSSRVSFPHGDCWVPGGDARSSHLQHFKVNKGTGFGPR